MGDAYCALTDLEVTFGGGIPSLIYVTKQNLEVTIENRFRTVTEYMVPNKAEYLRVHRPSSIETFLSELMDGVKRQSPFN